MTSKTQEWLPVELTGKTAVVCGSTQGIGFAAAQHLAGLGARVLLLARNPERLQSALAALPHSELHATAQADFSKPDDVRRAIAEITERETVHILVNNTGGPAGGPIVDADIEAFRNTFEQHLICNHLLAQAVLPGMKDAGYGRIINVISTSVKQPLANLGVSNTIRGAVASWAKTWANEGGCFWRHRQQCTPRSDQYIPSGSDHFIKIRQNRTKSGRNPRSNGRCCTPKSNRKPRRSGPCHSIFSLTLSELHFRNQFTG